MGVGQQTTVFPESVVVERKKDDHKYWNSVTNATLKAVRGQYVQPQIAANNGCKNQGPSSLILIARGRQLWSLKRPVHHVLWFPKSRLTVQPKQAVDSEVECPLKWAEYTPTRY